MVDISITELREMSVGSLEMVKRRIDEELQRRRNLERQHLINEFQKAWGDLHDAGIRVGYCEPYEETFLYLNDWDGFNFD